MAKGKYEQWLEPEGLLLLEGWARDGLTEKQIAENMGVVYSTFREWKKRYPALSAALKKSKEVADRHVENALYERACGGIYKVQKAFKLKETYYDEQGRKCEREHIEIVTDEIYVPGDTTAQIFYLKNRKPDVWRDKKGVELSGELETEQKKLDELIEQITGGG